jgi:hypothetical protein
MIEKNIEMSCIYSTKKKRKETKREENLLEFG